MNPDVILTREWTYLLALVSAFNAILLLVRLYTSRPLRQFVGEVLAIAIFSAVFTGLFLWSGFQVSDRVIRIVFRSALWFTFLTLFIGNLLGLVSELRGRD